MLLLILAVLCAVIYLLGAFAAFLVYSLRFAGPRYPRSLGVEPAGFIVVLGSTVRNGRVPTLLASRLDTAYSIHRGVQTVRDHPTLIVSGGRGAGESVSEAAAMADYLIAKGVPRSDVILEEDAATTRGNIAFSRAIMDGSSAGSGAAVVVTSDFHVFRTSRLCRRSGLKADVVGARSHPVLGRQLFRVLLREFALVLGLYPWVHVIVAAGITTSLLAAGVWPG